jgi:selenocysteine lyase/cysteine desulfurase
VDYALSWGSEPIEARVTGLAERLRHQLSSRDGVHVHDQGVRRCGIVTFTVDGVPAEDVERRLQESGVNVSVSLVDYARLDLQHRALPDLVRALRAPPQHRRRARTARQCATTAAMTDGP